MNLILMISYTLKSI